MRVLIMMVQVFFILLLWGCSYVAPYADMVLLALGALVAALLVCTIMKADSEELSLAILLLATTAALICATTALIGAGSIFSKPFNIASTFILLVIASMQLRDHLGRNRRDRRKFPRY